MGSYTPGLGTASLDNLSPTGKHTGFWIQCSWSKSSSAVHCVNWGMLAEHCDSQHRHPINGVTGACTAELKMKEDTAPGRHSANTRRPPTTGRRVQLRAALLEELSNTQRWIGGINVHWPGPPKERALFTHRAACFHLETSKRESTEEDEHRGQTPYSH